MGIQRRATSFARFAIVVLAVCGAISCGGASSTQPGTTLAVSSVTFGSTTVAAGSTLQGTVTLAAPTSSSGATIVLSSSNTAVATVQAVVMVPPGTSSAAFTVTAIAPGTATITASFNGTSQSPVLTVTKPVALLSISLSTASVIGGNPVTGTATLTGAAPTGGAMVLLTGADPITVPATVMVPAGSTSAMFAISTRVVAATIAATVGGSYGGGSSTAMLSVTPPLVNVATAAFGVTGTSVTETCAMINGGNNLDCTFNGSTSTAPGTIVAWDWTYTLGTTFAQTTAVSKLVTPAVTCAFVPPPPFPVGVASFTMTVTLKIHDSLGNVSAVAVDNGVRVLPQGVCGF